MNRELLQRVIDSLDGQDDWVSRQLIKDIRAELKKQEEREEPCKRCSSYKVLVESLEAQMRRHHELESDYRSAIATLESERKANEILTNELEKRMERDADLVLTYARGYDSGKAYLTNQIRRVLAGEPAPSTIDCGLFEITDKSTVANINLDDGVYRLYAVRAKR